MNVKIVKRFHKGTRSCCKIILRVRLATIAYTSWSVFVEPLFESSCCPDG